MCVIRQLCGCALRCGAIVASAFLMIQVLCYAICGGLYFNDAKYFGHEYVYGTTRLYFVYQIYGILYFSITILGFVAFIFLIIGIAEERAGFVVPSLIYEFIVITLSLVHFVYLMIDSDFFGFFYMPYIGCLIFLWIILFSYFLELSASKPFGRQQENRPLSATRQQANKS